MPSKPIPPEACIDLQIHLDKLSRAAQQCREGLYGLSDGAISRETYAELLRQQQLAQDNWERRHRHHRLSALPDEERPSLE